MLFDIAEGLRPGLGGIVRLVVLHRGDDVIDEAAEDMALGVVVGRGEVDVMAVAVRAGAPALVDADHVAMRDDEGGDPAAGHPEEDDVLDDVADAAANGGHHLVAVAHQQPAALRQRDLLLVERHETGKDGADRRHRGGGRTHQQAGEDGDPKARGDPRAERRSDRLPDHRR
jgi:hypothetical protein